MQIKQETKSHEQISSSHHSFIHSAMHQWSKCLRSKTLLGAAGGGGGGDEDERDRASLVVQWLGLHLPIQGTQIPSLVQEDPTGHRTTKLMCHNY